MHMQHIVKLLVVLGTGALVVACSPKGKPSTEVPGASDGAADQAAKDDAAIKDAEETLDRIQALEEEAAADEAADGAAP
jgi:hypothetical protein